MSTHPMMNERQEEPLPKRQQLQGANRSSGYPKTLQPTTMAYLLYDVLVDLPTELIHLILLYKEYRDADGTVYDGEWDSNGMRKGFGTQIWKNGDWEQGQFEQNQLLNGRSHKMSSTGKMIQELWKQGISAAQCGDPWNMDSPYWKGYAQYINGAYEGEFWYDKLQGRGEMKWESGNRYVGEFLHNDMHGKGKYIYPSGKIDEGLFHYNFIVSGKRTYPNGDVYEGAFAPGLDISVNLFIPEIRSGYGEWTEKKTGLHYKGYWYQDHKECYGEETDASGVRYEGQFHKGERHGAGWLTLPGHDRMTVCYDHGKAMNATLEKNQKPVL